MSSQIGPHCPFLPYNHVLFRYLGAVNDDYVGVGNAVPEPLKWGVGV